MQRAQSYEWFIFEDVSDIIVTRVPFGHVWRKNLFIDQNPTKLNIHEHPAQDILP